MKAYLLARVSTEDQADALPAQVLRLRDYAARNTYDAKLFEIKESAFSGDRKVFRSIVDEVEHINEHVIIVFDKIDRLTRDPTSEEYIRLVRMCNAGKVELHFPSDSIIIHKDSPATIKMILSIGVGSAQYYSSAIRDNVKRRQAQILHDGQWPAAAPFGYLNTTAPGGRKWIKVNAAEAAIVRDSFERYATGLTSLDGIRAHWRDTHDLRVSRCRIEKMLKNPFYYGKMRWNDKLYDHKYEPLIAYELFERVASVLKGYSAKPHRWAGLPYAYRGLIYCSECGCKITFERKKSKYIYGHCTQAKYKHDISYINEDKLTEQFTKILSAIHIPDDVLAQALYELEKSKKDQQDRITVKQQTIQSEIKRYQTRIDKMYEDRLDGLIADDLYQQKFKEFTKKQSDLKVHLQNIELLDNSRLDKFAHLLKLANSAPELFRQATFDEKREIINETLSNLCLDMDLLRWKYKKPFDLMASCNKMSTWQPLVDALRNP